MEGANLACPIKLSQVWALFADILTGEFETERKRMIDTLQDETCAEELGNQKLDWFLEGGALWHFTLLRLPFLYYNGRLGILSTSLHFSTPSHFNFILIIHLISSIL